MSTRGGGIWIVSCLLSRDVGREGSLVRTGGYVQCQSASVIGTWRGEGGLIVVDHANGDAGRVALPRDDGRDDGRDPGGDSRSRDDGNFGEGARWSGELGRVDGRELLAYAVSTGTGLDFLFSLLTDEDEERGD